MGQSCQICNHPCRLEIDRELVRGLSYTSIANRFGVSNQSVRNHAKHHLSRQLIKSQEMREAIQSQGMLSEIEELLGRSKAILTKAEEDGRLGLALNAIKETRGTLELLAKIAATMHQLRAQELQQEQLQAEQRWDEAEQEKLAKLSNDELMLLMMLKEKMEGLRDGDVVAAMGEFMDSRVKHTVEPKTIEQADTDESVVRDTQPPTPPVKRRRRRQPAAKSEEVKPEPVPYEERNVVPGSVRTNIPELGSLLGLDRWD